MYSHGAVASKYFGEETVRAAFRDARSAGLDARVRDTLLMLKALTREPTSVDAEMVRSLLAEGISAVAIEDAVLVGGFFFNMHNRVMDALGCDLTPEQAPRAAAALNRLGRKPLKHKRRGADRAPFAGRLPGVVAELVKAVEEGPGAAAPALRVKAMTHAAWRTGVPRESVSLAPPLERFVDAVALDPLRLEQRDFDILKEQGLSELELFELTIAASLGAGLARLELAWQALARARRPAG